jgi:apolipoprotein N-acyltransferase
VVDSRVTSSPPDGVAEASHHARGRASGEGRGRGLGTLAATLLAGLAGVAAALSFEPVHWVWLLPLAVAGLTLLCVGRRLRSGFWLGFVFGAAFMLVLLPWVRVIGAYAWIPLSLIEALFYGIAGLATAAVAGRVVRLPGWPVWAACSWALLEALRAIVPFGGFPWGRLAFAVEDTPVAPAFAYVGAPGVTFLVALVGTTLAWAVLRARRTPVRAVAGLAAAAVLACAAAVWPWQATSAHNHRVTVAAVQGNVPGEGLEAFAERRVVLNNHVAATQALARRIKSGQVPRPDLMVWPENSSDIDPYTDLLARTDIGDAAAAVGSPLLMGAVVGDRANTGWFNRAIVWSAKGAPGAYYDKIHPVPFGEYIPLRSLLAPRVKALNQIPNDMVRGKRPGVLRVGPARVGVLMCFEVAYDGLLRNVVNDGADVIAVPTNNATYTGTGQIEQQFAMSRLRAIETGRYVVVASTNGISGIVAPDGHVVVQAPQRRQVVLERQVELIHGRTPAIVLGPWPEIALSAVSVLSVLAALAFGYRRRARAGADSSRRRRAAEREA